MNKPRADRSFLSSSDLEPADVAPTCDALQVSRSASNTLSALPKRLHAGVQRRPKAGRRPRVRYRPLAALLEQRSLLTAAPTLTALIASTASATAGTTVTFTATVSEQAPGGAIPTGGMVTFSDQSGPLHTSTLSNGVATFQTTNLPVGTLNFTASYSGTAEFASSNTGTIIGAVGGGSAAVTKRNLNTPVGVLTDAAGDLFIADYGNNQVCEVVASTGQVKVIAGNGTKGDTGNNGLAADAELDGPRDLAFDSTDSNLYVSDMDGNTIRKIDMSTGIITTVAGTGATGISPNGTLATDAELSSPRGLVVDPSGNIFFADTRNNIVREIVKSTGDIMTVAGTGNKGGDGDNGPATSAELNDPNDVALDSKGDLFIADSDNNAVREVVADTGEIIAFAGNGTSGYQGNGGPATAAELTNPSGVAVDAAGDVFISDGGNHVVREVLAATGDIITVAGDGTAGNMGDNGSATSAELDGAIRVTIDSSGQVFVSDATDNVVREFTPGVTINISQSTTPTPTPTSPTPTPTATQLNIVTPPPTSVIAGQLFGLTLDITDASGDVDTAFDGEVTVILSEGSGVPITHTVTANNGEAAFSDLQVDEAGIYSFAATSPSLSAVFINNGFIVTPDNANTHLVVTTPPPANISVGTPFALVVTAYDEFGNIATTFSDGLTVTLAGNASAAALGGTTTAFPVNGVATFPALTLSSVGSGYILQVNSTSPESGGPISIQTPAVKVVPIPLIIGEQPLVTRKLKHGKPSGPSVLSGFELDFNTALDVASATNPGNYQIGTTTTKRVKGKTTTIFTPIRGIRLSYAARTNSVLLTFTGKETFKTGGLLTVDGTSTSGIENFSGGFMAANEVFVIGRGGQTIQPE